MVQGADGACRMFLFADRSGIAVPLTFAAASHFVDRVSGLDFSFTGEEEDMIAHPLAILRGSSDDN